MMAWARRRAATGAIGLWCALIAGSTCLELLGRASPVSAQPRYRVAVGGISAESNAFYPAVVPISVEPDQPRGEWLAAAARGRNVLAGQVSASREAGIELHPILTGRASSLGMVDDSSFETHVSTLIRQLQEATPPFDGVFLNLHGAMVVESHREGDAELVRRVRAAMGPTFPIVVLHDFHANVSPSIVEQSTVLITYKEHPHLDMKERGAQAARIMGRVLRGEVKPVQALVKPPILLNLIHHNTFNGPLRAIVAESRRLEAADGPVLAVSVPGGYQWADVPSVGPSVVVVTDDDLDLAKREAARLSAMVFKLRDSIDFDLPDARLAVQRAVRSAVFPVVIMDTGDNIGGGSAGDSTFLLRELLTANASGWVMSLADHDAVDAAAAVGVGGVFDFPVGAKFDRQHGTPVRIRGIVRSLEKGAATFGRGDSADSAVIAVVEQPPTGGAGDNLVIVTRRPSGLRSVDELTRHRIQPSQTRIIVSKGTVAPFETFQHVAAAFVMAASPGPTDVNPARFRFTHARRPLHGLP
jgi:microcystin degradation protein MlrC